MPIIGAKDITQLPSIWAEARSTATLHNNNRINTTHDQNITRTKVEALAHSSQYNSSSQSVYTPNPNPVVINRVA